MPYVLVMLGSGLIAWVLRGAYEHGAAAASPPRPLPPAPPHPAAIPPGAYENPPKWQDPWAGPFNP